MSAELRVLSGTRAGFLLRLSGDILIGRAAESGLRFDPETERQVSARHATIGIDTEGWYLRDEGSRNGTWLNGRRVSVARLSDGDRIVFGGNGPEVEFRTSPGSGARAPHTRTGPVQRDIAVQNVWLRRTVLLLAAALALSVALTAWFANRRTSAWASERSVLLARIDSVLAVGDASVRALSEETASLADALRGSQAEIQRLREALENASGSDPDQVGELRRQLQTALASLERQQLAAALDFRAIERAVRRAVAVVWVEAQDGAVVTGTAFAVNADATLVTTRHILVDGNNQVRPRRIAVQFSDSDQVWSARLLRVADDVDLAVIKVDDIVGGVTPAPPFNLRPDTLGPGTPVAWIGFPLGGQTPPRDTRTGQLARPLGSVGVITAVAATEIEIQGYGAQGASGSPILDRDGRVVAVLFGGLRAEAGRLVATPAAEVVRLLDGSR